MAQLKRLEILRGRGGVWPRARRGEAHPERVREGGSSGLTLRVARTGLECLLPGLLPHAVRRSPRPTW